MARHRLVPEPVSRLAIWSRRLAIFSLPAAVFAIFIERAGWLEITPVIVTFGAALALAIGAILLAIVALIGIWIDGRPGARQAIAAIFISLLLLAYPIYLGIQAYRLPAIADVTTDPYDPPRFEAIARLRTREANPPLYSGLATFQKQRAAYPDIEPLDVNNTPEATFNAVLGLVTKRKWRIVDERPPQTGRRDGLIEAIAQTPVMGFREDVAIRVRATRDGSRVDARSASRYGGHDFGSNASRIASLLEDVDDVASVDKTERPPKPPTKGKPAPAKPQTSRR
jgi:uncharacterized protein (DUF1499 family)